MSTHGDRQTTRIVFGLLHLRVHNPPMWSQASKSVPGGKRPRTYWKTQNVYEAGNLHRMRMTRCAEVACGGLARFDETARFNTAKLTCPECRVLSDLMNEIGFRKTLTPRRLSKLRAMLRSAQVDAVAEPGRVDVLGVGR